MPNRSNSIKTCSHGGLAVLFAFVASFCAHGQDLELYDSLNRALEKSSSDAERVQLLNRLAWEYLDFNDSIALDYATQGLFLARQIADSAGIKYAYILIGQGQVSTGEFIRGISTLAEAEKIRTPKEHEINAYNTYALGYALSRIGEYDSAKNYLKESIRVASENKVQWRQGLAYIQYSLIRMSEGHFDHALELLSKAESLRDSLPGTFLSYLYPAIAKVYLEKKDLVNARKYQDLTARIPANQLSYFGRANHLMNECRWYLAHGNVRLAMRAGLETIEVLKRMKDNAMIIEAYVNLSIVYYEQYQNHTAISYGEQAVRISERYGLKPLTAYALNQLGWFHQDISKYEKALEYVNKSLTLHHELGNAFAEIDDYNLLGLIYTGQEKYEKALVAYKEALKPERVMGNTFVEPDILYNLSILYENKKDYQKSVYYVRQAMKVDKRLGDKQSICKDYMSIGQLQIKQNLLDSAEYHLDLSESIAKSIGSRQLQVQILEQFVKLHEKRKDYEKAFNYARSISTVRDSIDYELSLFQVDEMRAFFLLESKEKEIELLNNRVALNKSRLEFQELTIRDQERIIIAAIILIFLVVAFLLYFYSTNRKLKSARSELIQLNDSLFKKVEEKKDLIAQLETSKEEALAASKAKSDFVANISHELRTPLNAVIGFAEILKGQITNESQSEFLRYILSGGRNLLSIVNDVLDLSKIESGKFDLSYSYVQIGEVLSDVKSLFMLTASQKNIEFVTVVQKPFPDRILIDDVRFRQILINLLSNAFKFTEAGSVELHIGAKRSENSTELIISVRDTGIGISEADQHTIFKAFSQVDQRNIRKYGGTGLGLTITQKLVAAMGGTISVNSTPGVGSEFIVRLQGVHVADEEDYSSGVISDKSVHRGG